MKTGRTTDITDENTSSWLYLCYPCHLWFIPLSPSSIDHDGHAAVRDYFDLQELLTLVRVIAHNEKSFQPPAQSAAVFLRAARKRQSHGAQPTPYGGMPCPPDCAKSASNRSRRTAWKCPTRDCANYTPAKLRNTAANSS